MDNKGLVKSQKQKPQRWIDMMISIIMEAQHTIDRNELTQIYLRYSKCEI